MRFFTDHNRAVFEEYFLHRYFPGKKRYSPDESKDPNLFVWVHPIRWKYVPNFRGRRVAIIGNREITSLGPQIDSYDEIIRINRMGYWRRDERNDGKRITCWSGLAKANIIPNDAEKNTPALDAPSCFPEIADQLSLIWAVTPFHTSMRFMDFLKRNQLRKKLFISGGAAFFRRYLKRNLPRELYELLYTVPTGEAALGGSGKQTNFDLLLTGVRTVLLTVLSRPAEIGLFGFDFYEGSARRPWDGHDLEINKVLLDAVVKLAQDRNIQIKKYQLDGLSIRADTA